jgi:hypothetical protein
MRSLFTLVTEKQKSFLQPQIKLTFAEKSPSSSHSIDRKLFLGKLLSETKELDSKVAMNKLIYQKRKSKTFSYNNTLSLKYLNYSKFLITKTIIFYIVSLLTSIVNVILISYQALIQASEQELLEQATRLGVLAFFLILNSFVYRLYFNKLVNLKKHRIKINNFYFIIQLICINAVFLETVGVKNLINIEDNPTKNFILGAQVFIINRIFLDAITEIRLKITISLFTLIYYIIRLPKSWHVLTFYFELGSLLTVVFFISKFKEKRETNLFKNLITSQEKEKFYKYYLSIIPEGIAVINECREINFINNALKLVLKLDDPKQIANRLFSLKNLKFEPKLRSARQSRTQTAQIYNNNDETASPKMKQSVVDNLREFQKMSTSTKWNKNNTLKQGTSKKMGNNNSPTLEKNGVTKRDSVQRLLKEPVMLQNNFGMLSENEIHLCKDETLSEAIDGLISTFRKNIAIKNPNDQDPGTLFLNTSLLFYTSLDTKKNKFQESSQEVYEIKLTPALVNNEVSILLSLTDRSHLKEISNLIIKDKYKTSLIANVIHELRTPLNGILSMIQVAQDNCSRELRDQYLRPAMSNARILMNLINDMLDVEQIRKGKLRMVNVKFKTQELMEDALSLIALQARNRGLEIELVIQQNVPKTFYSDPNRIRQVVVNLLGELII